MGITSPHAWIMAIVLATAGYVDSHAVAGDEKGPRDSPTLQEVLETTKPGTRIKVLQTDTTFIEGELVETPGLTLFNPVEARQYVLEWRDVDTLWELRVSKARGQKVGGTIGLTLGVIGGFYAGLGLSGLCMEGDCDDSPKVPLIVSGAFFGGLVGGCSGLLIGHAVSTGTPEWMRRYPVNGAGP